MQNEDESGGTSAKHRKKGDNIHIIICTLGIGGTSEIQKLK
jgi:LmbE family N-acetylglucosaminyl deacetylase